jgi:GNAT superfamily N-acetyltransferase
MKIRNVQLSDSEKIAELLNQLGYPNTNGFIKNKIKGLLNDPNEITVVAEDKEEVLAFISIHFIPQIALEGDFARISYFSVDENYRSNGLGKILEEYCEKVAKSRNCDRIEVHCHSRRERAHKFYYRQGYIELPKYLIKSLV